MTHTNQSARQVTGVSPRHAFFFTGTDITMVTTNVVGVDITATRTSEGVYEVTHNLGHTSYVVSLTAEMDSGAEAICVCFDRAADTFGVRVEDGVAGGVDDATFIHGIIYD